MRKEAGRQNVTANLEASDRAPALANHLVTFRLGEALFGFDVRLVQSVNVLPPLTPVPQAPPAVRGCVNLRGQIHLVVDLKCLLGLGSTEPGPATRLVVFKPALGDPFGVLVDRVGDVVALPADCVSQGRRAEGDADGTDHGELVAGIGKLEEELLVVLDAGRLLAALGREVAGFSPLSPLGREAESKGDRS
jgi:purine-binding chemotaxis protein CheW